MREKIATNLYKICSASRYGANFPEWKTLKTDQQDFFRNKAQLLFLTPIREEIAKAENHYQKELELPQDDWAYVALLAKKMGFEDCRHGILNILNTGSENGAKEV